MQECEHLCILLCRKEEKIASACTHCLSLSLSLLSENSKAKERATGRRRRRQEKKSRRFRNTARLEEYYQQVKKAAQD
jgi:hypothetical protein